MGVHNEYDSSTPLRFAYEQLTGNADFQALYADRLWEMVRIPDKPGDSYVYVQPTPNDPFLFGGTSEYIGKVRCTLKLVCVKRYPNGKGSETEFSEILKVMRRATCGQAGTLVHNSDGDVIAYVDESRFMNELPMNVATQGTFDSLQKGIQIYLSYRPPAP